MNAEAICLPSINATYVSFILAANAWRSSDIPRLTHTSVKKKASKALN
jgi:hypothetical protein